MTVDDLIAVVASRWRSVRVERGELATGLTDRALGPDAPHAADVALALALARGDAGALEVFERELVPDIRGALVKLAPSEDVVDDALQQLREKLLVGAPKIVDYRGRGALAAWIQVIAIREVLMVRRRTGRERPIDDSLLIAVESDPVLAITKRAYRAQFAEAFGAALASLAPRDRTLLRLCYVDRVGTEKLAELYAVHRVTMFRWLCDARDNLLDGIRERLAAGTGIAAGELDSLIRAVGSSLDLGW